MLGNKGGVARKLLRLSPWMVTFHCPAHRLDLAIGDIAKKVQDPSGGSFRCKLI